MPLHSVPGRKKATSTGSINLNAFRGIRLLRVLRLFRLVQYWKGVYKIFSSLIGAGPQIANIFVLLFVFMTVFALLGMQIFAGKCGSVEDGNRYHFDYYVPGMLVVLIVFSGGWVDAYESCLPAGPEVSACACMPPHTAAHMGMAV